MTACTYEISLLVFNFLSYLFTELTRKILSGTLKGK